MIQVGAKDPTLPSNHDSSWHLKGDSDPKNMNNNRAYERTLADWSKHWEKENLNEEIRKLINLADFDLHYGPVGSCDDPVEDEFGNQNEWSKYPGFSSACYKIKEALQELPSQLYIDADVEQWQDSEPEPGACQTCDGEGTVGDDDPTHEQVRKDKCPDCKGTGAWELFSDWWKVERADLVKKIVGKELSEYVR